MVESKGRLRPGNYFNRGIEAGLYTEWNVYVDGWKCGILVRRHGEAKQWHLIWCPNATAKTFERRGDAVRHVVESTAYLRSSPPKGRVRDGIGLLAIGGLR